MGNPTDELRARLDELGVEYTANDEKHVKETCWPYMGELMAVFAEYDNGTTRFACDTWCFTPEQAIAATAGKDIEHYDGSGRRGTVAILQGGRKPEEVLFFRDDGGVTHYLPEGAGTCHLEECEHEREVPYDLPDCDGGWYTEVTHDCDECGYENTDPNIRFCGGCGRKVVAE